MIYLIIFLLLIVLSYRYDYRKEKSGYNVSFYAILVIFILLAGLRYRVGGDTSMYITFFNELSPINRLSTGEIIKSRFAPGFVVLASLLRSVTDEFTWFQIIHSIIVNCVVFMFIRKNCRHVFFGILIFFSYLYTLLLFEQMRESFAVAIFLLAWPAFKNGVWWKWYIAALCAFLFHISAFMMFFLPLICLPWVRELFTFGKRTWIVCGLVFIVAIIIQTTLFKYIELISVTESMMERAHAYSRLSKGELFNFNRLIGAVIQYIAYPFAALFCLSALRKRGEDVETALAFRKESMLVLCSIYISIFSLFIGILSRYNNYFYLFAIVMMGDWIFTLLPVLKKKIRLGYLYWIILFMPMFGFNLYNSYLTPINKGGTMRGYMMYYPYSTIFDQTIDADREKTVVYIRKKMR